ncbi:MAG: RDD family protein [Anaerolineales bacterium]
MSSPTTDASWVSGAVLERRSIGSSDSGRRAAARCVDVAVGIVVFVAMVVTMSAAAGPSPDGTGVVLVAIVATFLVYLLYEVVLVAAWGRTAGKQVMGLVVVRTGDGGRPGFGRSFLRNLIPTLLLVGFFPLYPLPFVWAAFAADGRGPHDRLAGTRVVVRSR